MGSLPPHQPYASYSSSSSSSHRPAPYDVNYHGSTNSSTRPPVDSAMDSHQPTPPVGLSDPSFDILDWHPAYLSCQRYFVDHAQYEPGTQAVCALINIRLPFQWLSTPVTSSNPASSSASQQPFTFNPYSRSGSNVNSPRSRDLPGSSHHHNSSTPQVHVSPIPYIRRLVVTGFDKPAIMHGFFGDDYERGIMPHVECERRNYLFAAKHGGWRTCKRQYDVGSGYGGDESVPFMKPLDEAKGEELAAAEKQWSDWLAMEDWMVGPRAPGEGATQYEGRRSYEEPHHQGGSRRSGGSRGRSSLVGPSDGLPDGLPDGIRDNGYRSS
ncbi:hypothetical protein CKM354_000779300 [Cercospora kikuchii]|uniref:Uncharacterized protein n=1 Tax=Cercospora kikuchii TaxID=84275 RepID=A0A9P3CKP2_9PEZI|nr:uncharacterized protein CKM354_000779300 [Cercospora kikuchii]GIZ44599.1 hypothetical protein CKM354_000779300 [Cercospora kikuchii]